MTDKPLKKAPSTYQRMEKALLLLAENRENPPSLPELASACDLSQHHFQRLFRRWVGISPKRFSQYLNGDYIKSLLDQGMPATEACYQAGLSSPGRLHDLFIATEAMPPAQYRRLGDSITIYHGIHNSPFGPYLLGVTDRGICHMEFLDCNLTDTLSTLEKRWPLSRLIQNEGMTGRIHKMLFMSEQTKSHITLQLKGTNFQIQVWQALLRLPYGCAASYEQLASLTNTPAATRACASAIAKNPIAWLIPCHRVVRKIGETGQYRWGASRKKLILAYEGATRPAESNS